MTEINYLSIFKPFNTNSLHKPVFSYVSSPFFNKKTQKRSNLLTSCRKPINLITFITPISHSIANFTSKYKWVSSSYTNQKTRFLHNGNIGMTFLTVKSTAKNQFNPFIATLASNPTFISGLLALFLAQSIKVMLNFCVERKWKLRLLCSSGGMPSSHSALCSALTTSVGFVHGFRDSLFPVCLGFSLIVMYDAIGVRRHAGMQAQVLNKIIEDLFQGHPISERKLKELLGHTPSQVIAGALLGIAVACYCCQGCLVPV